MNESYRNFEKSIENDKDLNNEEKRMILEQKRKSEELKIKKQMMSPEEIKEYERNADNLLAQHQMRNESGKAEREEAEDAELRDRVAFEIKRRHPDM